MPEKEMIQLSVESFDNLRLAFCAIADLASAIHESSFSHALSDALDNPRYKEDAPDMKPLCWMLDNYSNAAAALLTIETLATFAAESMPDC